MPQCQACMAETIRENTPSLEGCKCRRAGCRRWVQARTAREATCRLLPCELIEGMLHAPCAGMVGCRLLALAPARVASLTMLSTTLSGCNMALTMLRRPWITLRVRSARQSQGAF